MSLNKQFLSLNTQNHTVGYATVKHTRTFEVPMDEIVSKLIVAIQDHAPRLRIRDTALENVLLLQIMVERKLRRMIDDNSIGEVFTEDIISKIYKILPVDVKMYWGLGIDEFISSLEAYRKEKYWPFYEQDCLYKLKTMKGCGCLMCLLYTFATGKRYDEVIRMLADKLQISRNMIPYREFLATEHDCEDPTLFFDFRSRSSKNILSLRASRFDGKTVFLPREPFMSDDIFSPGYRLPLYNAEFIQHDATPTIFLTDSLMLAKLLQEKLSAEIDRNIRSHKEAILKRIGDEHEKASVSLYPPEKALFLRLAADSTRLLRTYMNEAQLFLGLQNSSQTIITPNFVCASWYGGINTIDDVDFSPLEDRIINFFHYNRDASREERYELMLAVYAKLRELRNVEVNFIGIPSVENTVEPKKNNPEILSAQNLLLKAHECDVMIPDELKKELDMLLRERGLIRKSEKYLAWPIIRIKALTLLVAARGAGKSIISLGLAYALARGRSFMKKWTIDRPCKILYINGELSADDMDERVAMFKQMHKNDHAIDNVIMVTDRELNLLLPSDQAKVEGHIDQAVSDGDKFKPVSLLILDNLIFLARGGYREENWQELQKWFRNLQEKRGIAILLLHHTAKSDLTYGTSIIEDYADNVLRIEKIDNDEFLEMKIIETKIRHELNRKPYKVGFTTKKKPRWIDFQDLPRYNWKKTDDEKKKELINGAWNEKKTMPEIADMFGVSLSTIEKFAKQNNLERPNKVCSK